MTLVVLAADGGPDAGLGHLSRCSGLARALRARGVSVRALGLGARAATERYGVNWRPVSEADASGASVIVIDSYSLDDRAWSRMGAIAPLVVFADDRHARPGAALVVRSGASTGQGKELAGTRYACVGPEFFSCPPRRVGRTVRRVLVASGGGDRGSVGPRLAESLGTALPRAHITLVRGPYADASDLTGSAQCVDAPKGLFDLLVSADIAVTSAGQTMLEVLAVGTPCVALITAENQRPQAVELQTSGALTLCDSVEQAVGAARALGNDFEARRARALAGPAAVDGRGALRVADAILELARSHAADG